MRINDRSKTDFDRAKIKLTGHFDRRPTGRYFEPCKTHATGTSCEKLQGLRLEIELAIYPGSRIQLPTGSLGAAFCATGLRKVYLYDTRIYLDLKNL